MRKVNWNDVQDAPEFDNPIPGAYIAGICNIQDNEEKECLKIEWDFADGEYKGNNRDTFDRAGFWPITLYRSYKPSALPYFKAFKTAVEESNPGYHFDEENLSGLIGKRFGVILGEEEYKKNDGSVGTRLYVSATKSLRAIRDGDFKIPAKKTLEQKAAGSGGSTAAATQSFNSFSPLSDNTPLPWE